MNPQQTTGCPSSDRLRELLSGELAASEQEALTRHIETCSACQNTLDGWLSSPSVEGLAGGGTNSPTHEAALGDLMAHLKRKSTGEPTQAEGSAPRVPENVAVTPVSENVTQMPDTPTEDLAFLAAAAAPGQPVRLGHYQIRGVVGQGGFGVVLKAFDEKLERIVAIKALLPAYAAVGSARKRFVREARTAAAVKNEHVVAIYSVQDEAQPPYLVMELIDGISLQDKLDKSGPLSVKEILRIGMQTAEGLAAAHKQGLVHRDIKPANILLENGVERVKITDFGLARAVDDASMTQSGTVAGTPVYMSPEQASGLTIDHRSDLFSLGTVLYAMCTGHPPFRGSGTHAVLMRVIEDTPRPIREVNNEIPDWLEAIVAKLHAKKPEDRFQTAKEVGELLGQHLAHLQQPSVAPRPALVTLAAATLGPGTSQPAAARIGWLRPLVLSLVLLPAVFLAAYALIVLVAPIGSSLSSGLFVAAGIAGVLAVALECLARWRRRPLFRAGSLAFICFTIGAAVGGYLALPRDGIVVISANDPEVRVTLTAAWSGVGFHVQPTQEWSLLPGLYHVEVHCGPAHIIDSVSLVDSRGKHEFPGARSGVTSMERLDLELRERGSAAVIVRVLPRPDPPEPPGIAVAPFTADKAKVLQEAWAKHLGVDVKTTNSIGMSLRLIPPGEFAMTPKYRPRITKPYRIGIHKVTIGQFKEFVQETGHKTHAEASGQGAVDKDGNKDPKNVWNNPKFAPGDQHPVGCLDWNDAAKFCEWLSKKENKPYRLPTEAEWEWACRAGSVTAFFWGDADKRYSDYDWPHMSSHPVGSKAPNSWGLFDLYGMVTEFCLDWNANFPQGTVTDPRGPAIGAMHVIRGAVNTGGRGQAGAGHSYFHFGFRVVCEDVSPVKELLPKPPEVTSPPFPQQPTDVLKFFVGAWKMDGLIVEPALPGGLEARASGTQTFDFVAGGKFLRGFDTETKGLYEILTVQSWDPKAQAFQGWQFESGGDMRGPAVGAWDAGKHILTWKETLGDSIHATHEYTFVDSRTVKVHHVNRDPDNKSVFEARQTMTRLEKPPDIQRMATDPKRPAEIAVLDRLVGDWDTKGIIKTKSNPDGFKFASQVKSRKILGGRMIASEEVGLPGHDDAYWLVSYDGNLKAYRFWMFNAAGQVMNLGGGWDEAEQKMKWNWAGADGTNSSAMWHWRDPDRRDWTTLLRDAVGKTVADIQATSTRRAAEKVDADKLQGAKKTRPALAPGEGLPPRYRGAVAKGLAFLAKTQHQDGHWEAKDGAHATSFTALAGYQTACCLTILQLDNAVLPIYQR